MLVLLFGRASGPPPRPGREGAAGLVWGLMSGLKPYALIFLPYFTLQRKDRGARRRTRSPRGRIPPPRVLLRLEGQPRRSWRMGRLPLEIDALARHVTGQRFPPGSLFEMDGRRTDGGRRLCDGSDPARGVRLVVCPARPGSSASGRHGRLSSPASHSARFAARLGLHLSGRGARPRPAPGSLARLSASGPLASRPRPRRVALSLFDIMGRALYARFMSLSLITLCFLALVCALGYLRFLRRA